MGEKLSFDLLKLLRDIMPTHLTGDYKEAYEDYYSPTAEQYRAAAQALQDKGDELRGSLLDVGDVTRRRFGRAHFSGNGKWSYYATQVAVGRLRHGLSMLSGIDQCFWRVPRAQIDSYREEVREVARDLLAALGVTPQELIETQGPSIPTDVYPFPGDAHADMCEDGTTSYRTTAPPVRYDRSSEEEEVMPTADQGSVDALLDSLLDDSP
jgi:hypothetical protein